jgi:FKBP-type peptidyl-prolyl cis-trans isomerase FkpA
VESASICWREALVRMHVGDKVHLTCISELAQSETGPPVPDDTTVAFDLEILAPGGEDDVNLPEGLGFKTLVPGSGERPRPSDTVKVHYEGKLEDGTIFDSSIKRGSPVTFPLGNVIECWRYGLQKMHVGEKAQLTCPPDIAYGAKGSPPNIPPNATLTFEVELLGVEHVSPQ